MLQGQAISEFLASNDEGLQDFQGDREDWIEIHNDASEAINLLGYTLTDDDTDKSKWTFPSVIMSADEYLIVLASNKANDDTGSELHTAFNWERLASTWRCLIQFGTF